MGSRSILPSEELVQLYYIFDLHKWLQLLDFSF